MEVTFLGGCDIRDNSCFSVKSRNIRILLDCGHFELLEKEKSYYNYILDHDFVIISHSHIDHSNLLPRILLNGFEGEIICTNPTYELISYDLERRRGGFFLDGISRVEHRRLSSRFKQQAIKLEYYSEYKLDTDLSIALLPAGHMLGSAQILVEEQNNQLLYTGDICPNGTIIQKPFNVKMIREKLTQKGMKFSPKLTIIESTRIRVNPPKRFSFNELVEEFHLNVLDVLKSAGNLLITARPKERAQEILYLLRHIAYKYKVSPLEIIVMGSIHEITEIYLQNTKDLNLDVLSEQTFSKIISYPVVDSFVALKTEFGKDPKTQRDTYASGGLRIFLIPDTFVAGSKTIELLIALKNDKRNQLLITSYLPKDTNAELLHEAFNQIVKRKGLYLIDNELRVLDSTLKERGSVNHGKFDFRLSVKKLTEFPSHGNTKDLYNYIQELVKNGCLNYALVHGSFNSKSLFQKSLKKNPSVSVQLPTIKTKINI